MPAVHKLCIKDAKCDTCSYDYCRDCAPNCESGFCTDEIQCPHCVKLYQLCCDDGIVDPFNEDYDDDNTEEHEDKNICDGCLAILAYCPVCDVICNTSSKNHKPHSIIKLSKDKNMDKFKKDHRKSVIKHRDLNDNNRHEVIDIICANIKNISKTLIKYKNFYPKIISLGDILRELVSKDKVGDAIFFTRKFSKEHDIAQMINEPVFGSYSGGILTPPIVEARSIEMIDLLLSLGGNINAYSTIPKTGKIHQTCLIAYIDTAIDGHYFNDDVIIDFLNYLHEKGCDVNLGDPLGWLCGRSRLDQNIRRQKIMFWLYDHGATCAKLLEKQPKFMMLYNQYHDLLNN